MGIEEGSIIGSIQGVPIEEGKSYLAYDRFTDDNGQLQEVKIEGITETSYVIHEFPSGDKYYLIKSKVITEPEDFNKNLHKFKLIEQL